MLTQELFFPSLLISSLIFVSYSLLIFFIGDLFVSSRYMKKINKTYLSKIIQFLLGAIFSLFGFIATTWGEFSIFIFIFIPIIYIPSYQFKYSYGVGSFSVIAILIGITFKINGNYNLLILNYVVAGLFCLASIAASFIKWKHTYIFVGLLLLIYVITFLVAIPIYYANFANNHIPILIDKTKSYFYYSMLTIFSMITSVLTFVIIRAYLKFVRMSKNVEYKNKFINGFIIPRNIDKEIDDFLVKNKTNKAIVFLISFTNLEQILVLKGFSYLQKTLEVHLTSLLDNLKDKYQFLPYYHHNQYLLIIDANDISIDNLDIAKKGNQMSKRLKKDFLQPFEEIFNQMRFEEAINNKKINFYPQVYSLIYGVQSNNITDINNILFDATKNVTHDKNCIELLNTNIIYNRYSNFNKNKLLESIDYFEPNEINITFNLEKKKNNKCYYHSNAMILSKVILSKNEFYHLSDDQYVNDVIMCHIGALSIKEFVNQKLDKKDNILVIDYPYNAVANKNMNISELISSIESYELSIKNVILKIKIPRNKQHEKNFLKNINLLKSQDVQFMTSS